MEILEKSVAVEVNKTDLKELLSINNLPELCNSINTVISDEIDKGIIYCVWGQHKINRQVLSNGIRFYFPHCPYSLSISITTEDENKVFIRCTANKKITDSDFIESITEFMDDWVSGLSALNHPYAQVSNAQ